MFCISRASTSSRTTRSSSSAQKRKRSPAQPARASQKKITKKVTPMNFNFRNKAFYSHVTIPEDNFEVPEEIQSELKYFETFFTPDIFDKIANDSNQNSVQKTGISAQFTVGDTKDFIAIELLMGVIKLPAYTDY